MLDRGPLLTVVAGACCLGLALLLGVLSVPRAEASGEHQAAARAVSALTAAPAHVARERVPAGFVRWAGYRPEVRDGVLVRPDGSCSSPVALPRSFRAACRQHDLGYDLIRFATARGAPLGRWARVRVDRTLRDRLRRACAASEGTWCGVAASTAYTAVRANSLRQGDRAPAPESPASVGALAVGVAGLVALGGGAAGLLRGTRLMGAAARLRRAAASRVARPPAAPVSLLVALGAAASLTPSVLTRPVWLQGLFTGLLTAAGYLAGRRLARRGVGSGRRAGAVGLVAAVVLVAAAAVAWGASVGPVLDTGRASGPVGSWLQVLALATLVAGVAVGLASLFRAGCRRLAVRLAPAPARALAAHQRIYVWTAVAVVLMVGGVPLNEAGGAVLTSGPARRVVEAVGLPTAEENVLSKPSPRGAVRVYVGVTEGADADARAALAVRRLEARGGFRRAALVLAFPTGSGWVDPVGVRAVESRFDADVATVAVQPTYLPSWAALMVAREDHEAEARVVLEAVADRLARMPAQARPELYLVGQSLGVLAATGIDPGSPAAAMVCGGAWAGPPGGEVPHLGRTTVLANPDDPVVHWEPSLAWRRPDSYPAQVWLPVVSYLATGVDTIASLSSPIGHGHRYGPDQGLALEPCGAGARRTDLIWPPGV